MIFTPFTDCNFLKLICVVKYHVTDDGDGDGDDDDDILLECAGLYVPRRKECRTKNIQIFDEGCVA